MFNQTLISQSYVLLDQKEFTLKYFLIQDFNYGVLVEKIENGYTEQGVIKTLSNNYEQAVDYIYTLAKGFVTPGVLEEIVQDSFVIPPYEDNKNELCPA